ncbi:MAG TPA: serine/threonine-protein kinase [Anaeromyxobacteraceae bacterium]|nr:serine/threonine-protein kinase [Anaeromyxobacteraceae bacterium]
MRRLGRYRLVAPIASGGMAEVWLAEATGPAGFVKQVALKLVRADHGDDPEMVRMFVREANLASRLHHANVVHVFGFEEIEGRYAIAMEYVHGKSLRAVLDRCRETGIRLGLPRAVHVAAEVAKALAYAHRPLEQGGAAGLVHRDVSPHNVLVSFEGEVKLADFGIARAGGGDGLTRPGTVKGKAGYMAPEQWRGGPVEGRADVFALGVVLWEMCAGRRLFARETEAATLAAAAEAPVSPPSEWNEEVPPDLDDLVLATLERDVGQRMAAAEVAKALAEIRLRIGRSPEDHDLAPFMRRLWAAEEARRPPLPAPEGGDVEADMRGRGAPRPTPLAVVALGSVAAAVVAAAYLRRVSAPAADPRETPRPAAVAFQASGTAVRRAPAPPPQRAEVPPAPPPAPPRRPVGPVVRGESDRLGGLDLPDASSGDGVLFVNTVPWAEVRVDGRPVGDTPRELRLGAGRHRLRLSHPSLGSLERVVEVRAGERVRFEPVLSR